MTSRLFRPPASFTRFIVGAALSLALAAPASAGFFGSDPTPPGNVPGAQDAAQQAVRINNMEQDMRVLNGRIDELTHQIQQLQDMLKRAQEDNEFRLKQLEGGKGQKHSALTPPAATTPTAPSAPTPTTTAEAAPMDSVGPDGTLSGGFGIDAPGAVATTTPSGEPLGAPPAALGTLPSAVADTGAQPSASALGGPLDLSAIARGINPDTPVDTSIATSGGLAAATSQTLAAPTAGALPPPTTGLPGTASAGTPVAVPVASAELASANSPTLDPGADYDRAYSFIVGGDYASAEAGFKKFLTDFPGDPRAADARYWLGESYYSRHEFRDAATAFLATYKDHPTAQKAPDSLFKLGLSLEGLGEATAACATYGELTKKFPKIQASLASRVASQKQKLGCS